MSQAEQVTAGQKADELIATEVAIQDRMWGEANERADATQNQLIEASMAQLILTENKMRLMRDLSAEEAVDIGSCIGVPLSPEEINSIILDEATLYYPQDWSGLRDYGSNIANLVVAAAYIRSEIKRRLLLGEDTTRSKRAAPYSEETRPYVSSDVAAALVGDGAHVK